MLGRPSCTLSTEVTDRPASVKVLAVPEVAVSSNPSSIKRCATGTRACLSRSWVERKQVDKHDSENDRLDKDGYSFQDKEFC